MEDWALVHRWIIISSKFHEVFAQRVTGKEFNVEWPQEVRFFLRATFIMGKVSNIFSWKILSQRIAGKFRVLENITQVIGVKFNVMR
mgnify:CR=1 FL=1